MGEDWENSRGDEARGAVRLLHEDLLLPLRLGARRAAVLRDHLLEGEELGSVGLMAQKQRVQKRGEKSLFSMSSRKGVVRSEGVFF